MTSMHTRLSVFCDKVIEAGWLAVLVLLPILFDVYSQGVFEVDKVCLLRSIALVMSLAWVIGMLEKRESRPEEGAETDGPLRLIAFLRRPLMLPALVLVSLHLLASLTSVWPHASFWGSYRRHQGAYTTLSYVVIFFLILQTLRTQDQLERLVALLVLSSVPVSLYAFIQHYGFDPIRWRADVETRAASSLGNPIFVAAYLIMVIPLALRQLIRSLSKLVQDGKNLVFPLISAVSYFFALLTQLVCVVFTQSRGPLLGLAGGLFFFFLLLAVAKGSKGLALTAIVLALLLALLFAILNLPNTPLAALRRLPFAARLSRIGEDTTLRMRTLTWQGVVELSRSSPLRAIIGYGPESMRVVFFPHMLPELVALLGPEKTQDRSHNETLDALVTTGLIGVIAYLFLFGSLFYYGLKWLRLIGSPRARTLFAALLVGGGILGLLMPWLVDGTLRFAGVGIPAGMVAALAVYLVVVLIRDREKRNEKAPNQILLIALLSAIVAHFVETQSGVAITTTRTYFWVYAALMAVIALSIQGERVQVQLPPRPLPTRARGKRTRKRKRGGKEAQIQPAGEGVAHIGDPHRASVLCHSLLTGLLLATMTFDFVTPDFDLSSGFGIVALFGLIWLLGGAIVIAEVSEGSAEHEQDKASWIGSLLAYFPISLACWLISLPLRVASLPPSADPASTIIVYYLYLFIVVLAAALSLLRGTSLPHRSWQQSNWPIYGLLTTVAVLLVVVTNVNVVRADIHFRRAQIYQRREQLDESIDLYKRALALAPREDHYCIFLGQAYLRKAQQATDQRSVWFDEARKVLERARDISPLNPEHYANLGHLHRYRAEVTTDPGKAAQGLEEALGYYQQASTRSPSNYGRLLKNDVITAHRSLAMLHQQLGRIEEAIEEAKIARDLAPQGEKAELDALVAWLESQGE